MDTSQLKIFAPSSNSGLDQRASNPRSPLETPSDKVPLEQAPEFETDQIEACKFRIHYQEPHFIFRGSLPAAEQDYLLSYLKKVSAYKKIGSFQGQPLFSLYQAPLSSPAGERALSLRLKRRFEKQRIPAVATIAVNKLCQCECQHCSAVFYNHKAQADLDFEVLKRALLEAVELGVSHLLLLGGEPLLRKDLADLVASVPKHQSTVCLFSNGEYLSLAKCKALAEAGLMGVFVSLDSTDPETHNRLRRRPRLFHKALQGIENLQKSGIAVALSSYLSPQNLKEGHLEAMMDLGKKLEVQEVTFFDAIPSGRWLQEESCLLQDEDRKKILKLVLLYRKKADYPGITAQSTLTSPEGSAFCFAANTQFYLSAQGDLSPCDFTPLTVGRYPDFSIADLWKKMIRTPPYHERAKSCRMQDLCFRKKYIHPLGQNSQLPVLFPYDGHHVLHSKNILD